MGRMNGRGLDGRALGLGPRLFREGQKAKREFTGSEGITQDGRRIHGHQITRATREQNERLAKARSVKVHVLSRSVDSFTGSVGNGDQTFIPLALPPSIHNSKIILKSPSQSWPSMIAIATAIVSLCPPVVLQRGRKGLLPSSCSILLCPKLTPSISFAVI